MANEITIGAVGSIIGALATIIGGSFWLGGLDREVDTLANQLAKLEERVDDGVSVDAVARQLAAAHQAALRGKTGERGLQGDQGEPGP